jgi:hypothetical protein
VAALAACGEWPYVKVLIYIYFFQGCQDCQLSVPGPLRAQLWHSSKAAAGHALASAPDNMGGEP